MAAAASGGDSVASRLRSSSASGTGLSASRSSSSSSASRSSSSSSASELGTEPSLDLLALERWVNKRPLLGEVAQPAEASALRMPAEVDVPDGAKIVAQSSSATTHIVSAIAIVILIVGIFGRYQWGPVESLGQTWSFVLIGSGSLTLLALVLINNKEKTRAIWDRVTLATLVNCASPVIILGLLATLIGIGGCITAISGWNIPGLEFILKNIPISIAFSLTLVRGGVHAINHGVMTARRHNRERQLVQEKLRQFHIEQNVIGFDKGEEERQRSEITRLNNCLPPELSVHRALDRHTPYGKPYDDLVSVHAASSEYRACIKRLFEGGPELSTPKMDAAACYIPQSDLVLEIRAPQNGQPSLLKGCKAWYEGLYESLPSLGVLDIALGGIMLFTALTAIVFLAAPSLVPAGLDVFTKDPYLSVPFAFILLSNCISCVRTGYRMLSIHKREDKRAFIEEDLALIDIGLEKECVRRYYEYIKSTTEDQRILDELKGLNDHFLAGFAEFEKRLVKAKNRVLSNEEDLGVLHNQLKPYIPYLAKPALILGLLLAIFGAACLGMSVTHNVPAFLEFLTKNTSLSVLFSGSLLTLGFSNIYRGASMTEVGKKEGWKKESRAYRQLLLGKIPELPTSDIEIGPASMLPASAQDAAIPERLLRAIPKLPTSRVVPASMPPISGARVVDIPEPVEGKGVAPLDTIAEPALKMAEKGCMFNCWIKSPNVLCVPHGILGLFLLGCSIAGIIMVAGAPVPSFLDFIARDASASAAFFFSLLVVGADATNTAYRMYTYDSRKTEDQQDLELLKRCYKKIMEDRDDEVSVSSASS